MYEKLEAIDIRVRQHNVITVVDLWWTPMVKVPIGE
jgi:hypothetical protein